MGSHRSHNGAVHIQALQYKKNGFIAEMLSTIQCDHIWFARTIKKRLRKTATNEPLCILNG